MLRRAAGAEGDPETGTGPPDTVPYRALLLDLRRFLRTDGAVHLEDPNVSSIGLGYKVTGGRRTPELCVQFTVEEKRADLAGLAALGTTVVPRSIPIAGVEVPTDVVQRGDGPA